MKIEYSVPVRSQVLGTVTASMKPCLLLISSDLLFWPWSESMFYCTQSHSILDMPRIFWFELDSIKANMSARPVVSTPSIKNNYTACQYRKLDLGGEEGKTGGGRTSREGLSEADKGARGKATHPAPSR